MSLNSHLNAFLALLEQRPEAAREIFGSLPRRVDYNQIIDIHTRIETARENIKADAVVGAIRSVFIEILKIEPPAYDGINDPGRLQDMQDAYLAGAMRVEGLLTRALETCQKVKKQLGPAA